MKKHLKGDDLARRLSDLRDALSRTEPFDVNTSEQALRALAESRGLTAGKYIHPLRVALLGVAARRRSSTSPSRWGRNARCDD